MRKLMLLVVAAILLYAIGQCDKSTDHAGSHSASSPSSESAPSKSQYMPGNGTYKMGGVNGNDWGVYTATVPADSAGCRWSIRSVAEYRDGEILREGTGTSGQEVSADIEPDGKVGWTDGMIGDHRLVFMTSGCGSWRLK